MNFFAFLIPLLLDEPFLYNQHKQYGDRRREATIVSDWKQAWHQFNNKNREKIQIEEL